MIDQNLSSEELFIKNFEPYPNVVHPIVRGEEGMDTKTEAFRAYQNGDYESSAELFGQLYPATQESSYLFYQANALIQVNKAREAIPLLQEHLKASDGLADKTNWYLAMAYLQIDDEINARKMLETVLRNGKFKVEEAKEILDALD
jgi:predicted Zn-dependent protease